MTIYDLDMTLGWTATVAADETTLEGTVQIPEVSHEAIDGLSDYAVRLCLSLFLCYRPFSKLVQTKR